MHAARTYRDGPVAAMHESWPLPSLWSFEARNGMCGVFWDSREAKECALPNSVPDGHYIVSLHASPIDCAELKLCDRHRFSGRLRPRSWMIVDATAGPDAVTRGPISLMHVYVPLRLLRDTCESYGLPLDLPDAERYQTGGFAGSSLAASCAMLFQSASEDGPMRPLGIDTGCEKVLSDLIGLWQPQIERTGAERLSGFQHRRLDRFLNERLSEPVSLEEMAMEAGLSKSHFVRAFGNSFGRTPMRELRARRLARAATILESGSEPITAIAAALGFSDQSHFTRMFRATYGMTPAEWRRTNRN
jgi:AraC-like DNA-binding protein